MCIHPIRKVLISIVTAAALLIGTMPSSGSEAAHTTVQKNPTRMVVRGQRLEATELASYESKAQLALVSQDAGGAEASTGTIVLAVIGALVLIGAVIAVAAKNDEETE